jgi:hypothetical protein
MAELRAYQRVPSRLVRRTVDLVRRRGPSALARAVRLTAAAVAAYVVALQISPHPQPLLAPLTALLVVQVTLFSTLTNGLQRVASVVAGVMVAVVFSTLVGFTWWSLGGLIAASIIVGQLLRLGPHLLEVPISAMLVLAVGYAESAAAIDRIAETLIGAGIGVAFNVLAPPAVRHRGAGVAVQRLADEMAELLGNVARQLVDRGSADHAGQWMEEARRLGRRVERADRAVAQAEESRRLNPRAVGTIDSGPTLRSGLDALEHCTVSVRGLCRSMAESVWARPDEDDVHAEDVRWAFALLLHDLAAAISAFGHLVRAEAEGDADEGELALAVETVRETRARLTELLLVDPRDDPEKWELHGALLTSVERALRELDAEERARRRERLRPDGSGRPRTAQAVERLRATTGRIRGASAGQNRVKT